MGTQWRNDNDTSVDASWDGIPNNGLGIAVEIAASSITFIPKSMAY